MTGRAKKTFGDDIAVQKGVLFAATQSHHLRGAIHVDYPRRLRFQHDFAAKHCVKVEIGTIAWSSVSETQTNGRESTWSAQSRLFVPNATIRGPNRRLQLDIGGACPNIEPRGREARRRRQALATYVVPAARQY